MGWALNSPGKFYRVTGGTRASLGPMYPMAGTVQQLNQLRAIGAGVVTGQIIDGLRAYKYPGIMCPEYPARGAITLIPAQADIANGDTLTLTDNAARVFTFWKSGPAPVVRPIDIQTAVTSADVRTAIIAAIDTYTAGAGSEEGFLAVADGVGLSIVQANAPKSALAGAGRGTWVGKTVGDGANGPIELSAPTGWTTRDLAGGKDRLPGVVAMFATEERVLATPVFYPSMQGGG